MNSHLRLVSTVLTCLALLMFSATAAAQTPPSGVGFDGTLEPAEDASLLQQFAYSMDFRGDVAVVGQKQEVFYDTPQKGPRQIHIFRRESGVWTEEAIIVNPGGLGTGANYGNVVATNGDTIFVSSGLSSSGLVYVYSYLNGVWQETQQLTGRGPTHAYFGKSLSVSRDRLVVGGDPISVYRRTGSYWSVEQELDGYGFPGSFAAIWNDRIVATAPSLGTGGVVFYEGTDVAEVEAGVQGGPTSGSSFRVIPKRWEQMTSLVVPGVYGPSINFGENFGASIDIHGDWAFVGAPHTDAPFDNEGAVYAFRRLPADWFWSGTLDHNVVATQRFFGASLALEGDTLFVGAPAHQTDFAWGGVWKNMQPGRVLRYELSTNEAGNEFWTEVGAMDHWPKSFLYPRSLLAVSDDELYVSNDQSPGGSWGDNVLASLVIHVTGSGALVETILDVAGDGSTWFHTSYTPYASALARDAAGNLYAISTGTDTVFKVSGSSVEAVIGQDGAGPGMPLRDPNALAVDAASNLFVAGSSTNNVFKVTPAGVITEVINSSHGIDGLDRPEFLAVDSAGRLFVCSGASVVYMVATDGGVSEVLNRNTLGRNSFLDPLGMVADSLGNVYVGASQTNNVIFMAPGMDPVEILSDANGLESLRMLAMDASDNLYMLDLLPNGDFRILKRSASGTLSTVFVESPGEPISLVSPTAMAVSPAGTVFLGDVYENLSTDTAFGSIYAFPPLGPAFEMLHGDMDIASPTAGPSRHGSALSLHGDTLLVAADQVSFSYPYSGYLSPSYDTSGPGAVRAYDLSQPTAMLVIGDVPGASPFVGASHAFNTQVGPQVDDAWTVTPDKLPDFALPGRRSAHDEAQPDVTPRWMRDGRFAAQLLVWDPEGHPDQPEQWSAGLEIQVTRDGRVLAESYGSAKGQVSLRAEIIIDGDGRRVLRFPYRLD